MGTDSYAYRGCYFTNANFPGVLFDTLPLDGDANLSVEVRAMVEVCVYVCVCQRARERERMIESDMKVRWDEVR